MASILFITFDCKKPEYSQISYSTASMIAALCTEQVDVKVFPLDVKHGLNGKRKQGEAPSVEPWVLEELERNRSYFGSFDYLAIPLTAWTEQYVEKFLETLAEYGGKVILGGYEVTALSDEALQSRFPRADYYIKGYAEGVLRKLIVQGWEPSSKVIHGKVDEADLASPYLSGVLNTYSKSIHWETTRGCPFKCGFCEWGNASDKKPVRLNTSRLDEEIALFRRQHVGHINILDATFNSGPSYVPILEKLLSIPQLNITCQARFENLLTEHGTKFLELCKSHADRIHLEFGLQTIHENEMGVIGRKNDMAKVGKALQLLFDAGVDYETSLIYAIPGQTPLSFIDSIEFLYSNGCNIIRAYPLRIPANSKMDKIRDSLGVESTRDTYTVESVGKASSFSSLHRRDMDNIARNLCAETPVTLPFSRVNEVADIEQVSPYQWRIRQTDSVALAKLIIHWATGTFGSACYEIQEREGKVMGMAAFGALLKENRNPLHLANRLLNEQVHLTPKSEMKMTATVSASNRLYVFGNVSARSYN